ncbi:MAG: hypothetical protein JNJ98_14735, partial [Gemmatimonadetes bacterium]|nr:hypothetical protein [Gemmatimonadota bacterium]
MAYHLDWIELVCPYCKGELCQGPARAGHVDHVLACQGCDRSFDVICGIPDLRVAADPYISIEGDVIKGRMLESTSEASNLEAMARTY